MNLPELVIWIVMNLFAYGGFVDVNLFKHRSLAGDCNLS